MEVAFHHILYSYNLRAKPCEYVLIKLKLYPLINKYVIAMIEHPELLSSSGAVLCSAPVSPSIALCRTALKDLLNFRCE